MNAYSNRPENNSTLRPEVDAQPKFESSNGSHVRPGVSGQQVVNHRVVDTHPLSQASDAPAADDLAEVQSETSNDISDGVVAGGTRPVGAAGARRYSSGSAHDLTLDDDLLATEAGEASTSDTVSEYGGGFYQHFEEPDPDVSRQIAEYVPDIPAAQWAHCEAFVRSAVSDATPAKTSTAHGWLTTVAGLTVWCWQSAGFELTREVVFHEETISRFVNEECANYSPSSRGTTRSRLMSVSRRLIGVRPESWDHERFPKAPPTHPYSRAEIVSMRAYMDGQATEFRRRTLGAILSLGMGAGLSSLEMLHVRPEHVEATDNALLVHVVGERPRTVALLAEWEDLLFGALDAAVDGRYLFLQSTKRESKNALFTFLKRCNGFGTKPNSQRLRSTWLVTHLNGGTPVPVLIQAAGLTEMSSLNRYLRFLEPVNNDLAINYLRMGN